MIVIDSSAVIAIMLGEPTAAALSERILKEGQGGRVMSTANYVEAGTVLAGRVDNPDDAAGDLDAFLRMAGIELVPVDEEQARIALRARVIFGRGFGARAKLNFGDSFAYALARSFNAPLLFIGDDFSATDITSALPAY